jgi:hypothetical protein
MAVSPRWRMADLGVWGRVEAGSDVRDAGAIIVV